MMKLQVLVSDEMTDRLDKLAKYIGSSRSSVCGAIIAKSLPEWEKIYYSDDSLEVPIDYEQLKIQ